MAYPPLRWQYIIGYVLFLGLCVAAILLCMPPSLVRDLLGYGIALFTPALVVPWILRTNTTLQVKRDRRFWGLIAVSIAMLLLTNLVWIVGTLWEWEPVILPWTAFLFLVTCVVLWSGLSIRSRHMPRDTAGRTALCCDLLVGIGAIIVIAFHLSVFETIFSPTVSLSVQCGLSIILSALVVTFVAVMLLLANPVPRYLHKPRAALVTGIYFVLVGYAVASYMLRYEQESLAKLCFSLGALGPLLYGVAAMWEAALYRQHARFSRVVDSFPSLTGQVVPTLMLLAAAILALHHSLLAAHDVAELRQALASLALVIFLIVIRQVATFIGTRHLYLTLQRLYGEVARSAVTDAVTSLFNHRYFMERFNKEIRRAIRYNRPIALIFADLDHFKKINDTYGHRVGDQALAAVAQCLRDEIRDTDVPARYGGEEFVVLLPETTLAQAERLAERLRLAVESLSIPIPHQGALRLTMSFGVSSCPETALNQETLMATADRAMYYSKANGRNRVSIPVDETCADTCNNIAIT